MNTSRLQIPSDCIILKDKTIFSENRYKHEMMVDGEPVIFEILDTCPKVSLQKF